MVITVAPMVLNIMTGVALWTSALPMPNKGWITLLIAFKYGLYFYTVLLNGSRGTRNIGLAVSMLLNLALVVYFVLSSVWCGIPGCALLAAFALLRMTENCMGKRGEKK
ncbi:MAG: hypothetical protein LUH51_09005 [Firmicutes bacterium]|nr:hypothetical protein [Bacillota bacterium]